MVNKTNLIKMAIKVTKFQIIDGPKSKNLKYPVLYLYAKFHALIIKSTILS